MSLRFSKMQGLGNDFVVVDATRTPFQPNPDQLRLLTDRRFGVGCDQVLVVDPAPDSDVDFGYRIYNADGSQSGQCANGSRCFVRFVRQHGLTEKSQIRVRTATAVMDLQLLEDGRVRVDMGAPRFAPEEIPMRVPAAAPAHPIVLADGSTVLGAALSVGNPHFVIESGDLDGAPVTAIGEALQSHVAFPDRVNVGFIQFVGRQCARLRVFERGSGETLACGSGACAAMVAGRLWGRLDASAAIELRGGTLELQWAGKDIHAADPIWMTGPAESVFEGSIEWPS